jgi:hypothetical protein
MALGVPASMNQAEVALGPLVDLLVGCGFLEEWNESDRSKVRAALEQALTMWSAYRYS